MRKSPSEEGLSLFAQTPVSGVVCVPFVGKQDNAGDNQREKVVDNAVGNQGTENQRLVMVARNNVQEQTFENAQTARNLTEHAENLRDDENADKDIKRNVHERRERVVQHQRGEQNVGTADENLRQRHFERGNVKFDVFDDYGLFVKQRRAEINQQAECGDDRYGQSGQVRNRTFAESVIRRQKIAENNQKETGDQIGKTGKSDHADDFGSVKTPARVEPVTDCAAGNDGMAGVVADGKADKSGKNPFPGRQFAADVSQSQKVIRGQGDITAERGHAG